jgi:DNA-binding transcriptional LysR family regulator
MNFRQIEVFRALMLNGTVVAAARFLNVSQPGVSKLIRNLEERTGVKLFSRVKGRLEPTRAALMLNDEVERAYQGVDRVRSFLARLGKSQASQVRIAAAHALAHTLVLDRLAKLDKADLHLVVDFAPFKEMVAALLANKYDFGVTITEKQEGNLQSRRISSLEFVLAVPKTHRLARRKFVVPGDLEGEALVSYKRDSPIYAALSKHGMGPPLDLGTIEVGSSLIAAASVEKGFGLAFVDRVTVVHERFRNIVAVPVRERVEIPVFAYYKRETLDSQSAAKVLAALSTP